MPAAMSKIITYLLQAFTCLPKQQFKQKRKGIYITVKLTPLTVPSAPSHCFPGASLVKLCPMAAAVGGNKMQLVIAWHLTVERKRLGRTMRR